MAIRQGVNPLPYLTPYTSPTEGWDALLGSMDSLIASQRARRQFEADQAQRAAANQQAADELALNRDQMEQAGAIEADRAGWKRDEFNLKADAEKRKAWDAALKDVSVAAGERDSSKALSAVDRAKTLGVPYNMILGVLQSSGYAPHSGLAPEAGGLATQPGAELHSARAVPLEPHGPTGQMQDVPAPSDQMPAATAPAPETPPPMGDRNPTWGTRFPMDAQPPQPPPDPALGAPPPDAPPGPGTPPPSPMGMPGEVTPVQQKPTVMRAAAWRDNLMGAPDPRLRPEQHRAGVNLAYMAMKDADGMSDEEAHKRFMDTYQKYVGDVLGVNSSIRTAAAMRERAGKGDEKEDYKKLEDVRDDARNGFRYAVESTSKLSSLKKLRENAAAVDMSVGDLSSPDMRLVGIALQNVAKIAQGGDRLSDQDAKEFRSRLTNGTIGDVQAFLKRAEAGEITPEMRDRAKKFMELHEDFMARKAYEAAAELANAVASDPDIDRYFDSEDPKATKHIALWIQRAAAAAGHTPSEKYPKSTMSIVQDAMKRAGYIPSGDD